MFPHMSFEFQALWYVVPWGTLSTDVHTARRRLILQVPVVPGSDQGCAEGLALRVFQHEVSTLGKFSSA